MNLTILAQNIRRLRITKRYSQSSLADAANLSLSAIKNLESAKNEPRVRTVQAIAKALDVKLQELFLPVRELKTVRFRSNKMMQNRENIIAELARWIDDYNYLEEILGKKVPFKLREIGKKCSNENETAIIEAASKCRSVLNLKPKEPIHDICGLLESAGIKVKSIHMTSDSFFGISVCEEDGGPAVVVNVWDRIPVERRIFSAAHELGHLILHREAFDIKQVNENTNEENEANLFAGHFLMPDKGFFKELEEASGLHWVDRILKLKRIYRVSYKAVIVRLLEHGIVDNSIWQKFNYAFQQRYKMKLGFKEEPYGLDRSEPYGMREFDFYEDQFSRLVREAIERDKISLSRGAELLNISIEEIKDILMNWEAIV